MLHYYLIFQIHFFSPHNPDNISPRIWCSQCYGTWTSHNQHRRKHIKSIGITTETPDYKTNNRQKKQCGSENLTGSITNGFIFLTDVFLENIITPKLCQITLRNGINCLNLYRLTDLLSAGKNFIACFFLYWDSFASDKTIIDISMF